ncbi:MAG: hypothetical protein JWN03_6283 [Nocardia sp.]|uniref:hypothetical protein n=1 Tax=Nocardia sp. TaxID=1821 RepID=UPI00260620A2|nr:hypothetical protein [Nocardia sp.]MCU1646008.1 hypothetical protein [Nocardia sp.]
MATQHNSTEDTGPPGPIQAPLLAVAVSAALAIGTGLLDSWPAAVTVFLTTMGLFGARGIRRRSGPEEQ